MRKTLLALIAILLPHSCLAVTIGLYGDRAGNDHEIVPQAPGVVQLHVIVTDTPPGGIREVRFALQPVENSIWIGDTRTYPVLSGNSQTGVVVNLGGCLDGPIHVLTVNLLVTSFEACHWLEAIPRAGTQQLEVIDCDGNLLGAQARPGFLTDTRSAVFDRFPVAGAIDVPTDVDLRWHETGCLPAGVDVYGVPIRFGTEVNPPEVGYAGHGLNFDPGPLAAGTTYYWSFVSWYGCVEVPVWSFRTAGNVAVTPSSWSGMKTLYR